MNEGVTKAVVVTAPPSSAVQNSSALKLALYNADGTLASTINKQPALADTAGGATLATLIADHNALLALLRAANILATS